MEIAYLTKVYLACEKQKAIVKSPEKSFKILETIVLFCEYFSVAKSWFTVYSSAQLCFMGGYVFLLAACNHCI